MTNTISKINITNDFWKYRSVTEKYCEKEGLTVGHWYCPTTFIVNGEEETHPYVIACTNKDNELVIVFFCGEDNDDKKYMNHRVVDELIFNNKSFKSYLASADIETAKVAFASIAFTMVTDNKAMIKWHWVEGLYESE